MSTIWLAISAAAIGFASGAVAMAYALFKTLTRPYSGRAFATEPPFETEGAFAMYEIKSDRLQIDGRPARFEPTEHVGGRIEPVAIVLHDTAGGPPGNSISWLRRNPRKVSAHCIVLRDGTIVQLADFDRKTNHCNPSTWRGAPNCNGRMIGIEIVNPGHLRGTPDSAVSDFGKTYRRSDGVVECKATQFHGAFCWMRYTDEQMLAVERLIAALGAAYPTITEVIGHHDVSPGRKDDPTPLMNWGRMRAALGARQVQAPPAVEVRHAQQALIDLGYHFVGGADGHMGPRTRAAVFAFQEANKLKATGLLDEITLDLLRHAEQMGAKEMATGARDEATAETISSPTITATKVGEAIAVANLSVQTGNAVSQALEAVGEASKVVDAIEQGQSLAGRIGELGMWLATPRGISTVTTLVASAALWALIRYLRNRRVNATKTGKQN